MKVRSDKEFPHKVVLLGDSRVGKTSLLSSQMHKEKHLSQNPTIGCQCNDVEMFVDNQKVSIQVWDTAGQEIYRALVPIYLRDAHAAIIVYDITDMKSFKALPEWMNTLFGIFPQNSPLFFVANKIDLEETRQVEDADGEEFARKNGGQFHRTSALSGEGIEELFKAVAKALLQSQVTMNEQVLIPADKKKDGCC
ncbi:small GTP-binding protein, putative [Trichomonas vaginalis G3]|uniref:Small GTP-binding protein, putative n=1 Tax=Trichomonas vaginalis (strain ATCC PRA-98 / G3) TaxID=412133 RepID=A2FHX4_TRIV3|nr:GTPase protein [Trichomonas vaginalis G3]EAX95483.1 small GTP-binding protein, putative [Trichomonas vaginalis G3]KAI5531084.1 GTPase protein [Trichomonas vaginalis G3]|eukprot:XP_001308413.1 small GTP-binding protein [Trichomonas vaginalis G3]